MLSEIPRIPMFPEHMISKQIRRLQQSVQDDVIPVSTGIYSEYKLMQRLQAIPKPNLVDYEDPIFYETVDASRFPCKLQECQLCGEEYGNKKNVASQCSFCGVWNCSSCICPRKRYHPRAKDAHSERLGICYKCDDKFLSLTLNHGFVEQKLLFQEIIKRVKKQKQEYEVECDKRQSDSNYAKDMSTKNIFQIASLKKEQVQLKKGVSKLQLQRDEETMKLRIRQKYLAILMRKKQGIKSRPVKEQPIPPQKPIEKVKRNLSQRIVYNQSIKIDESYNQESMKQTNVSRQQQLQQSPPNTGIQQRQTDKALNFYNYNEWNNKQSQSNTHVTTQQNVRNNDDSDDEVADIEPKYEVQTPQSVMQQKLAEIFSKPALEVEQQKSDEQQLQSLDDEAVKAKRAALMRAAIQQSRKSRQLFDQQPSPQAPSKCACSIY